MQKSAIIAFGGKQYSVKVGDVLEVQKLQGASGQIVFDQVLLIVDGDQVEIGTPTISGLTVTATFIEEKKGEKLQVFKYKSKSKYRKLRGARQTYTYLKIDAIGQPEKKAVKTKSVAPKKAKPAAAKKSAPKPAPASSPA